MNKKGQGQLVAYVLLIGFTIVLGVMVGGWMIRQAGKTGESAASRAEADVRCADVAISAICSDTTFTGIKNTGYFTISKLKVNGIDVGGEITLKASTSLSIDLNIKNTIIPFIKIEGKEVGCTTKSITVDSETCV